MEPKIHESLQKVVDILMWLGKYPESNAIQNTIILMKNKHIETTKEWEKYVLANLDIPF